MKESKIFNIKNQKNFTFKILLVSIFIIYAVDIFIFPESFVHGGSAVTNWAYFKDILNNFNNFDYSGLQELRWNYAEFRWGFFIFPLIFSLFVNDPINILFLTTPIIVLLALLTFILSLKNHLSIYGILFFAVTWIIHPEIKDFIYSFSTNGVSLFALSIVVFFLSKYDLANLDLNKKIIITLIFFWFYGIKETNLMFAPFLIFMFKNFEIKHFLIISITVIFLYSVESIGVYILSEQNISYGRFFYQLFDDSPHAWNNIITSNLTKLGIDISGQNLNAEYARNLADGAIFSRWYFTGLTLNFFYYIGLVISIINILDKKKDHFIRNISWLYLTYFLTISFSLVSLFPPKPFIHLNFGIQIIGLPLALILFCKFLDQIFKKIKFKFLNFVILSFLLILLNIKSINHYYKVGINDIKNTDYNLLNVARYIENFTNKVNSFECLLIKGDPLLLYHVIDEKLNKKHKYELKKFMNQDKYEFVNIITSKKIYELPNKSNCKNNEFIYKFDIISK
tara:strand:+ start:535 stop:2064 length:1530 start_codon:yes stop_codon:yes gene_type:complete